MTRIKRTLTLMSLCLLLFLSACGGNRDTSVVIYDDAPVSAAPLDLVNGRIAKGRRKASVITSSFNIHDELPPILFIGIGRWYFYFDADSAERCF